MKSKSSDQLIEAMQETGWRRDAINFARFQPRFDGEFFDKDYEQMLAEAPKKPTIQGFTSQEAMLSSKLFVRNLNSLFSTSLLRRSKKLTICCASGKNLQLWP